MIIFSPFYSSQSKCVALIVDPIEYKIAILLISIISCKIHKTYTVQLSLEFSVNHSWDMLCTVLLFFKKIISKNKLQIYFT